MSEHRVSKALRCDRHQHVGCVYVSGRAYSSLARCFDITELSLHTCQRFRHLPVSVHAPLRICA